LESTLSAVPYKHAIRLPIQKPIAEDMLGQHCSPHLILSILMAVLVVNRHVVGRGEDELVYRSVFRAIMVLKV
jgi:hypothetical protein